MRSICMQSLLTINRGLAHTGCKSTLRMWLSGLFHYSHHPSMLAVRVASWIIPLMWFLVPDTNDISFFNSFTCFNMLVGVKQQMTFGFRQTGLLLGIPEMLFFHDFYISAGQSKFRNCSVCVKQMSFVHKNGMFSDFFHYFSVSPLSLPCISPVKNATVRLFFGTDVTMVHSFLLFLS